MALLKQRSRPYLFSNAVAPVIAAADDLRANLQRNQQLFRSGMEAAGFDLIPGEHPIIPVMLYEERVAAEMADKLLNHGILTTCRCAPYLDYWY